MNSETFIPMPVFLVFVLGIWKLVELAFYAGKWSWKVEQAIEELYKRRQERKTKDK